MHDFTWRLDIDLNGADDNSAYLTSHVENLMAPPFRMLWVSTAEDNRNPISVEGSRVWRPTEFQYTGDLRRDAEKRQWASYIL